MATPSSSGTGPDDASFSLSVALNRVTSVDAAVDRTIDAVASSFDDVSVTVWEYHLDDETAISVRTGGSAPVPSNPSPPALAAPVADALDGVAPSSQTDPTPDAIRLGAPEVHASQLVVPVGHRHALSVGTPRSDAFDDADLRIVERVAAALAAALDRIDSVSPTSYATVPDRLSRPTADASDSDAAVDRLLSLARSRIGLDAGILSRVEGTDCVVEAVADTTGTYAPGATDDLGATLCEATLADDTATPLAVADTATTDHPDHLGGAAVGACLAAPVVVDGEAYGTVSFVSSTPRANGFDRDDREFVALAARWVGAELARRARERELESFRRAAAASSDGVAVLDDEEYVYVDETHAEVYGYDRPDDLVGTTWRQLYDDDEADRIESEAFPVLASDGHWCGVATGQRPDGSTFPTELSLATVGDGRTVCTVRDNTERVDRERELESFQRALDEAADGVAILDGGEYTYVDQTHVDMYGFDSTDQLLGDTWRKLYDDDEVARLEAEAFPALESEGYWRGKVTGSRPDGSTFPAELSLTIVDDGRLVCTVRDETERRERERELELKEQAMDEATVGIQITDPTAENNPLVYVNDGFERLTGYTSDEALGENPRLLQGENTDPQHREQLREAIDRDEPVSLELENHRKDGTPYWCRLSVTPVTDDDGVVRNYIGIQQDVTERREREQRQAERVALLERVYEVTTDPEMAFEEKVSGLLDAGREYLDLPYGFLTRIDRADDPRDGLQTIVQALGSHDLIQTGESTPLSQSYCRKTIEEGPKTITNAGANGWIDDPAYELFELETYISGEVPAGDELYGTLCFASADPQEKPFDEFERTFVGLLGRWAGYEIDRRSARENLREQQQRLELALAGTNTGLAEWTPETGAVTWDDTLVDIVGRDVETTEEFEEVVYPDDRDRVRQKMATMTDSEGPWTGEFRVRDGDGDVIWLGTRAVVDDTGASRRVIATATDVTDKIVRKRRSEAFYETTQRLFTVQTRDEALEVATQTLEDALGLTVAGFYDPVGDALVRETESGTGSGPGESPERVERGSSPLWEAFESGSPVVSDDIAERDGPDRGATPSACYFPVGDQGVLAVDPTSLDRLHEEDRQLVEVLVTNLTSVLNTIERQRALVEERERFRLLAESVDEYAFFMLDEDGAIQTWNAGAADLFGYDTETAVGTPVADLHPAADRESGRPERLLEQARVAGESADEGWRVRADGSTFYADLRYAPLGDDGGGSSGYAVIVRDMTERRLQRRRTERFVEEAEIVVTVLDTDGTITYTSGSAERVLGHDPGDLVGENLFDYLHPDGREHAMDAFFECVDESADAQAECRLRSPDGEWRTVVGRCRNMLDDEAVDGILVYLRDVTESKERARRFESIFNQTFQFTGLLTPDGTVVEANRATGELSGVSPADLVGEPFDEVPLWSHSEAARERVRAAVTRAADGEFVRHEVQARGQQGFASVDFSAKPVRDEDGDVSLIVVEGRDITARQQQRRTLRVMQRVMRHNMRNDLTMLRGWTEMLRTATDEDKRDKSAATVRRVLDRWESLTEKMTEIRQALRRGQGGRTHVEVTEVVEEVAATARDDNPAATIETETSVVASNPVPSNLSTAIEELVDNAAKTTDTPTITVSVSTVANDWVEISVRDDGPGIPDIESEVLETGEESPLRHGNGLGLWMVRTVVTQVGGEVSVDAGNDGTVVSIRIPTTQPGEQFATLAEE